MTRDVTCPCCHALIAHVTDAELRASAREARRRLGSLRDAVVVCTPCARQRGVAMQAEFAMEASV
jgi:hypothetical protein